MKKIEDGFKLSPFRSGVNARDTTARANPPRNSSSSRRVSAPSSPGAAAAAAEAAEAEREHRERERVLFAPGAAAAGAAAVRGGHPEAAAGSVEARGWRRRCSPPEHGSAGGARPRRHVRFHHSPPSTPSRRPIIWSFGPFIDSRIWSIGPFIDPHA